MRFKLEVKPHTSLFIGGYTQSEGESHGTTARDREKRPLIPGSAAKGALREAAARLVGSLKAKAEGQEILEQLFGREVESPDQRRRRAGTPAHEGDRAGLLRFSDLRVVEKDLPSLSVRHHVSLLRATRQAAPQRLFQNQVTPAAENLRFIGTLESTAPLTKPQHDLLEAAIQLTDQLGGGRGRGLGLVEIRLEPLPDETCHPPVPLPEVATGDDAPRTWHLVLEATEPVKLGVIKDGTNVLSSKDHLDGSALRGAAAAALARLPVPDDEETNTEDLLEEVFGGACPARFGNAFPGDETAIPAPRTLREPKAGGPPRKDDALRLCATTLWPKRALDQALSPPERDRPAEGTYEKTAEGWRKVKLQRRLITRGARDHASGRGAVGKLFSLDVLEPPLVFHAPVTGTPRQLERIARAARAGLLIGGSRSRGFGRLQLLEILTDAEAHRQDLPSRHRRWTEALQRLAAGENATEAVSTGVFFCLGPLAVSPERLKRRLKDLGLELLHGAVRRQLHTGWNGRLHLPRQLDSCYVPGSTFLVKTRDGASALPALETLEREGLGPGRADGWGHVVCCHPIHLIGETPCEP